MSWPWTAGSSPATTRRPGLPCWAGAAGGSWAGSSRATIAGAAIWVEDLVGSIFTAAMGRGGPVGAGGAGRLCRAPAHGRRRVAAWLMRRWTADAGGDGGAVDRTTASRWARSPRRPARRRRRRLRGRSCRVRLHPALGRRRQRHADGRLGIAPTTGVKGDGGPGTTSSTAAPPLMRSSRRHRLRSPVRRPRRRRPRRASRRRRPLVGGKGNDNLATDDACAGHTYDGGGGGADVAGFAQASEGAGVKATLGRNASAAARAAARRPGCRPTRGPRGVRATPTS